MAGFVFAADLHLKPYILTGMREVVGDTYYGLEQIVDYCLAGTLPLVLGGDTFDRTFVSAGIFEQAHRQLSRMARAGLAVYYLDGNHDRPIAGEVSWGICLGFVQGFAPGCCRRIGPFHVAGLDCLDSPEVAAAFAQLPREADIVVGHQSLDLASPLDHSYRLEAAMVPAHVQLVLLGHIHIPLDIVAETGVRFMFPGSTCMLSSAEPREKGFLVVTGSPGDIQVATVPLRTRPYHDLMLQDASELDKLASEVSEVLAIDPSLPTAIQKPFLRIRFDPELRPEIAKDLRALIGARAHLLLVPLKQDPLATTEMVEQLAQGELLKQFIDPLRHPAAYQLALDLLNTAEPQAVLGRTRSHYDVSR